MASIQILDLYPTGSELFKDSESFMGELVDNALGSINGGLLNLTPISPFCPYSPLCKPSLPRPRPISPILTTRI